MTALNLTQEREALEAQRAAMVEFCKANLAECCAEMIEWSATAVLRNGKVRHLAKLAAYGGHNALAIAEAEVKFQAMQRAALAQSPPPLPKWIDDLKGSDPHIDGLIEYLEGRAQSPVVVQGLSDVHRATIKSIASWLANRCQQVQLGPDEWGWQSEFDQQLAQASDELQFIISALDNQQAAPPSAPVSAQPRLIPDSECWQRRCAMTTTGCRGSCAMKPGGVLHNAFVDGDEKMDVAIDAVMAADKGAAS